jgi:hypothetical protein
MYMKDNAEQPWLLYAIFLPLYLWSMRCGGKRSTTSHLPNECQKVALAAQHRRAISN